MQKFNGFEGRVNSNKIFIAFLVRMTSLWNPPIFKKWWNYLIYRGNSALITKVDLPHFPTQVAKIPLFFFSLWPWWMLLFSLFYFFPHDYSTTDDIVKTPLIILFLPHQVKIRLKLAKIAQKNLMGWFIGIVLVELLFAVCSHNGRSNTIYTAH